MRSHALNRSLVHHEIEMAARRSVDFENLEYVLAQVGEGMGHACGNIHDIVLADDISFSIRGQRTLPTFHDVDIVGLGVVMQLTARAAGHEPVEMDVELLGAKARVDE